MNKGNWSLEVLTCQIIKLDPESSDLFITHAAFLKHISKLTENGYERSITEFTQNQNEIKQKVLRMFDRMVSLDQH